MSKLVRTCFGTLWCSGDSFVVVQQSAALLTAWRRRHHHHHRLCSPRWPLTSSNKCLRRPLSWTSFHQFLQLSFLASSFTLSVHLDFGWPRLRWPPGFVHISSIRNNTARPPQSTGFYYINCIWFIVKLFCFSVVSLPPLTSVARILDHKFCNGFSFRRYFGLLSSFFVS